MVIEEVNEMVIQCMEAEGSIRRELDICCADEREAVWPEYMGKVMLWVTKRNIMKWNDTHIDWLTKALESENVHGISRIIEGMYYSDRKHLLLPISELTQWYRDKYGTENKDGKNS